MSHHSTLHRTPSGGTEVARPLRDPSRWGQWTRQRRCAKTIGHCWHPDGFVDWWCCECSGETDGMPPQRCVHCTGGRKLVLTIGIPGSGKTTFARRWVSEAPHWRMRVNRDDLRDMTADCWTGRDTHEKAVTAIHHAAVSALLRSGFDVVCDDTNLNPQRRGDLVRVADAAGATVEVHDFTDVPVETCIERDKARGAAGGRCVGESVIRRMHSQARTYAADTGQHNCMAGFEKVLNHLGQELERHADRDQLTGVRRAVFLSRGGHAPGDVCPTEKPTDPHEYWCEHPDDECTCPAGTRGA